MDRMESGDVLANAAWKKDFFVGAGCAGAGGARIRLSLVKLTMSSAPWGSVNSLANSAVMFTKRAHCSLVVMVPLASSRAAGSHSLSTRSTFISVRVHRKRRSTAVVCVRVPLSRGVHAVRTLVGERQAPF